MKKLLTGLGVLGSLAALGLAMFGVGIWPTSSASAYGLYSLSLAHGVRLLPIGARRHVRADEVLPLGGFNADGSPPEVLQSDDGHTVVAVWVMLDQVRVYSAPSGALRASFQLPVGVQVDGLSPDGSRLFGSTTYAWYAISTATGRVAARLNLDCCPPLVYDAARGRLYILQSSQTSSVEYVALSPMGDSLPHWTNALPKSVAPPGPPRLVAYDLTTARPVATVVLKGVTFGSWDGQSWTPGLALSPNGRQIAIYDARTNRLTVIDPQRMRVARAESLSHRQSVVDHVAQWLGLEPQAALAKGEQLGADLQMRYSANGQLLYVTGDEVSPHTRGTWRNTSIGILAIDVASGEITGQALKGWLVSWLQPAPDGSALYTFAPFGDNTEPLPSIVQLNPTSLQIVRHEVVTLRNSDPQYYVLADVTHAASRG